MTERTTYVDRYPASFVCFHFDLRDEANEFFQSFHISSFTGLMNSWTYERIENGKMNTEIRFIESFPKIILLQFSSNVTIRFCFYLFIIYVLIDLWCVLHATYNRLLESFFQIFGLKSVRSHAGKYPKIPLKYIILDYEEIIV